MKKQYRETQKHLQILEMEERAKCWNPQGLFSL